MNAVLTTQTQALAALLAVLGLILIAAKAARKTGLVRSTGLLRPHGSVRLVVLDTLILDRTRKLQLIRCEDRKLVLLTGGSTDQVVGWLQGGEGP